MHAFGPAVGAATVLLGAALATGAAPAAHADPDFALNGTYRVISNGDWAKTNEVRMNEAVVVSTWTFSTSCTDVQTCDGTVTSDKGWTVPAKYRINRWIVEVEHPGWLPCPDGTRAPGFQRFQFFGTSPNGHVDTANVQTLKGFDRTEGPGGACGRNTPTAIEMPVRLDKM
ncbi:hypothetical protein V4U86_08100 [Mycobacterium sp. AMU20-3851]|uniref:hypothetical protein n=1 Tax=Mycobacterium sp. AMU20-3851 TaxID=3122055 RepID=UPI0037553664